MGVRVEGSSPRLSLGLVLRHAPALLLWGHPRVASGLSSERLTDLEWGMGHALVPARAVLCEAGSLGECQREVEALKVPLEGPAVGHLLAASDARGRYP